MGSVFLNDWRVSELIQLYRRIHLEMRRFQSVTGISCPSGCGICCSEKVVETTTVLELIPLSLLLWKRKTALHWLEKIERADADGQCVFYRSETRRSGAGCCAVYQWRPLICRLFGFSFRKDKNGNPVFITCKTLKQQHAAKLQQLGLLKPGACHSLPVVPMFMTDYSMMVRSIDPLLGTQQLPVNRAARIALEKTGLLQTMQPLAGGQEESPGHDYLPRTTRKAA